MLESCEELARFGDNQLLKLVRNRIVEVGEHEVLPDQDAEFVAQIVKFRAFVNQVAGHPHHVEVGSAQQLEQRAAGAIRAGEADRVGTGPNCATTEYRHAVDAESKAVPVGATIDLDAPEAGPAEIKPVAADTGTDCVEDRVAMGARPPRLDRRESQSTPPCAVSDPRQSRSVAADLDLHLRRRAATEVLADAELGLDRAVGSVQARSDIPRKRAERRVP